MKNLKTIAENTNMTGTRKYKFKHVKGIDGCVEEEKTNYYRSDACFCGITKDEEVLLTELQNRFCCGKFGMKLYLAVTIKS